MNRAGRRRWPSSRQAEASTLPSSARRSPRSSCPPGQINEREEEDPDDVHEVPVKSDEPGRRSARPDAPAADGEGKPAYDRYSDQQVERVEPGRAEIEHE